MGSDSVRTVAMDEVEVTGDLEGLEPSPTCLQGHLSFRPHTWNLQVVMSTSLG